MSISALAAFSSQAREIKFYNVPTGMIQVGDSLYCRLEPTNRYHSNCVALWLSSPSMMLGHVAGEAACHLAPLLRCGFVASRLVVVLLKILVDQPFICRRKILKGIPFAR